MDVVLSRLNLISTAPPPISSPRAPPIICVGGGFKAPALLHTLGGSFSTWAWFRTELKWVSLKSEIYFFTKRLSPLETKLRSAPFNQMMLGDVFQARVSGSVPLIFQYGPAQTRLICPVPSPFADSFPVVQEWEQPATGRSQVLRLDYLHHIPLGPNIQNPANLSKLKAALDIHDHTDLTREVQMYHSINSIYTLAQGAHILMQLGFYRTRENQGPKPVPLGPAVLRVAVNELTSEMEQYPAKVFSDQALRELQDLRYQASQRQKFKRK